MKYLYWVLILASFMVTNALAQVSSQPPEDAMTSHLKMLRTQADVLRQKESDLQGLQLEVDRLKLEVEKKKAMVELGRVPGAVENASADLPDGRKTDPVVALKYVFITSTAQEALIEVDGRERRVKVGDELPGGVIKSISSEGLVFVSKDGKEIRWSID